MRKQEKTKDKPGGTNGKKRKERSVRKCKATHEEGTYEMKQDDGFICICISYKRILNPDCFITSSKTSRNEI